MTKTVFLILMLPILINTSMAACQCSDLEKRIERLEKAMFEGAGTVRTKDVSSPTPSISPQKKNELMKELKKIQERRKAEQTVLDQLMKEDP
jgi:hypothetical protein